MKSCEVSSEISFERCDLSIAEFCFSVMDAVWALVAYVDRTKTYRYVNESHVRLFNKPVSFFLGAHISECLGKAALEGDLANAFSLCLERGERAAFEGWLVFAPGGERYMDVRLFPHIVEGRVIGAAIISHDLTEKKALLRDMVVQNRELRQSLERLEENNAQLRQLLESTMSDRDRTESSAYFRVSESIAPYLHALKSNSPSEHTYQLAKGIENAILNYKPLLDRKLYELNPSLSAQERRLAHLVVEGKTSQEISEDMGKSVKTVEYHRSKLRKKLGLGGQRISLRTFLVK